MTKYIVNGTRAVVINQTAKGFSANLYVNCARVPAGQFDGIHLGDITLMRKAAKRLATVEAWAAAQVAA